MSHYRQQSRGAIELSILSEYYQKEIAAYHTDNVRCYVYGEDQKYTEMVLLIYDGRHYDALAISPAYGVSEEFDQTVFPVQEDKSIGRVHELALDLVNEEARNDGDIGNCSVDIIFTCVVCGIELIGQKESMQHAEAINHLEFVEKL
ncbi:ubiquitin thioesterase OTU1-like [Papaver somniferum]|uniref:ubiquitin thioesterase OTU1-like n=1 Tax=Papaver somniferum TaxID=3469 RepID=UPI000E7059FE|nr:ubiquitin thioesterase OTU1-like [Papaver somniferum]